MARCTEIINPGLIDSPLKLQLTLLFFRHPRLCGDMWTLSEWIRESPWAVEEALEAMADLGFLGRTPKSHCVQYRLEPSPEHWSTLQELARNFDDPQGR